MPTPTPPSGLFAAAEFEARIREYWYASAAMSAMNFWVARARRRARGSGVVFVVAPVGSCGDGGGRPERVR
jgi:hypothetical protein